MARAALCLAAALLLVSAASAVRLGGIERATPDEEHIQAVALYAVQQVSSQGAQQAARPGQQERYIEELSPYGELSLGRILTARKQIVAGAIYFLTLEATEALSDATHTFEVAVYEPFGAHTNTLKLTHFKEAHAQAPAKLSKASHEGDTSDLLDSVVAEGAAFAVMQLTQQSNSLLPWTLQKVVSANTVSTSDTEGGVYQLVFAAARGQEVKTFQVNMRLRDADEWMVLGSFVPLQDGATQ